ncbi:MAG: hypothetical protein ACJ72R_09785 [Nitrososphaeraceae archaeon]
MNRYIKYFDINVLVPEFRLKEMKSSNSNDDNKEKIDVSDDSNDVESKLLRQTNEDERLVKESVDHIESHLDLLLVRTIKVKLGLHLEMDLCL